MQAGLQEATAMAPLPEDLSVRMRLQETGITGPAGAHAPIQVIMGLPGLTVRMEPLPRRGVTAHTIEAIRPPGAHPQVIGVPVAVEAINPQEDLHQAAVATIDHLLEHPEVPAVTGAAVAAVQGVREAIEVMGAVLQEALAVLAGLQGHPVPAVEVEGHKFQNSII